MNNKVRQVAKFILCTGIVISAPIIAAVVVNFVTAQVEERLQIVSCQKAAQLDKVIRACR